MVRPGPPRRLLGRLPGPGTSGRRPRCGLPRTGTTDRDRPAPSPRGVPPRGERPPSPCADPADVYAKGERRRRPTDTPRPRPDLDDRRCALPLRAHDPLRDPVPRHRHRHPRRRDPRGRGPGPARPLLGRAGLVGLWVVLVLECASTTAPASTSPISACPACPSSSVTSRSPAPTIPPRRPVTALGVTEDLGSHGFPSRARIEISAAPAYDTLGIEVSPVAFGPVLLRDDNDPTGAGSAVSPAPW